MTDELEPLSDDLFKVLDVERARPPVPADQLARVTARLDAAFATALAPTQQLTPSRVQGPGAGLVGKAMLLAVGLTVGAIGGAQVQARYGAPREVIIERRVEVPVRVEVQVPVPAPLDAPPPPVVNAPARPKEPVPVAAPLDAPPPVVNAPTRSQEPVPVPAPTRAPIELERLLVEQATSALGRGQGPDALAACVEHQRRFPSGQLAEERESVAIRALVLLGRKKEAVARAEAFRIAYPESLLIDVVNTAVQ
jgi:hypothetical protein